MTVRGAMRVGALVGGVCGVVYAFGGLAFDALTTGLNAGTALAFLALIGMPAIGVVLGAAIGGAGNALTRH